jgi:membrane-bound ClpP family serine protease
MIPTRDIVSVLLIIVGVVLFLYGANYYEAAIGYAGVGLFIGGFVVYAVWKVYEVSTKGKSSQNP